MSMILEQDQSGANDVEHMQAAPAERGTCACATSSGPSAARCSVSRGVSGNPGVKGAAAGGAKGGTKGGAGPGASGVVASAAPVAGLAQAAGMSAGLTPGVVKVRRLRASDSISAITALLHRAYADQVAMGLQPLAGRQGDDVTAERCSQSECWLAVVSPTGVPEPVGAAVGLAEPEEAIVGVILFEEKEKVTFPEFFLKPEVAHFAQFAVDPDRQGMGIGRLLLDKVEQRALEGGYKELALSMAEPDTKLRAFYEKRGFRLVSYWQWPYTNYRSCILSKALD